MTSTIFYLSRSGNLVVMDSNSLDRTGVNEPIIEIALDLINAGFEGVAVDTKKLSNGEYFFAVEIQPDTPEGKLISDAQNLINSGRPIPSSQVLINRIKAAYKKKGVACQFP